MPLFKSLLSKHILVSGIMLLMVGALLSATLYLTIHIQGEANRINLAGRQRMHIFHIANHAHFLTTLPEATKNRDLHIKEITKESEEYEQAFFSLEHVGRLNSLFPLFFSNDNNDITDSLNSLKLLWRDKQKPLLSELIAISDQTSTLGSESNICITCHDAFVATFSQVDDFVSKLTTHNNNVVQSFRTFRIIFLSFFTIALFGVAFFVKKHILKPIKKLHESALAIENSLSFTPLEVDSVDEIGQLTSTFNLMSDKLSMNLKELEDTVRERTALLRRSNEELQIFISSISHDLQEPLRAIQGFTIALKEDLGRLSPECKGHFVNIMDASDYMNTMINDLLNYSHIAYQDIQLVQVDMKLLLEQVLNEISSTSIKASAQITVKDPLPKIIGHHNILRQILINILSNSIKFIRIGVTPEVIISGVSKNGTSRIVISDNGIGIDTKDQERIFNIFERLHGMDSYSGSGVGLASVRKGIERLGGTCGVDSVLGQGSSFWLELPSVSSKNYTSIDSLNDKGEPYENNVN